MIDATVPAGTGAAFRLGPGERVEIINTHGTQVVDTWAFAGTQPDEHLSMSHNREVHQRLTFGVGDTLITNRYNPILTFVGDTSPGDHDTLIAACSERMWSSRGHGDGHPSCAANLAQALSRAGRSEVGTPDPWNLFMAAPVTGGQIDFQRPRCAAGATVELHAAMDCLLVLSTCPDDLFPTNGGDGTPRDIQVRIT